MAKQGCRQFILDALSLRKRYLAQGQSILADNCLYEIGDQIFIQADVEPMNPDRVTRWLIKYGFDV